MSALDYDEKTVAWLDPSLQAGFTQVPNSVLCDPRITAPARLVYALLARFAWQDDACYPGQSRLAGLLGVSERHLRRLVKELEHRGVVQVRRRGLTQTNVYRLLPAPSSDRTPGSAQDRTSVAD